MVRKTQRYGTPEAAIAFEMGAAWEVGDSLGRARLLQYLTEFLENPHALSDAPISTITAAKHSPDSGQFPRRGERYGRHAEMDHP